MFDLSMNVGELIARAVIVYLFLFTLLRYGGKKHVGDLTPFDLVVLLILSETVNGALIGNDNSLIGGLNLRGDPSHRCSDRQLRVVEKQRSERLFEGVPKILVRHGHVNKEVMAKEQVTQSELIEALR
jgi:uncharacterized membrane protein YcaP (DUF421 family)